MQILLVLFFSAVGIQFIYFLVLLIILSRKRVEPDSESPPVSVIVCAHDEEQNLRELIPALLAQEYSNFEVIIVNDRSNDGTYDFLLEETKRNPRLRMVNVEQVPGHVNGKKFGITLGIKAAANEWILLMDADCRPAGTTWISSMGSHFDDKAQIVLGVSPYLTKRGFLNLFVRFESLITSIQYTGYALAKNPYMGVGRNLAYRKSLFLEKKGFNQFLNVTGGDDDLFVNQHANSVNTRVSIQPSAHVFSYPKTSWGSFFYQKVRHLSVGKRYRLKHRILLGAFALTWIVTWFTGVALLIINITNWPVIAALALRIILLTLVLRTFTKQLALSFELWAIPVLDFLYSIYYISTAPIALLTKKVRWRK